MGCALSHLTLWWQLIHEKPEIQNYLILEDDAKLQPGWEAKWEAAAPYIPDDYDIVYLGGILPPNRPGFESCK
jgi:GR25 family glycosyltransferase involved in LPS biosynthesis